MALFELSALGRKFDHVSPALTRSLLEAGEALLEEALAPFADHLPSGVEPRRDLIVIDALGREEHQLGSDDLSIRQGIPSADPTLGAVNIAEAQAFVVPLQEAGLAQSSVAGFVRGLRAFSAWCAAEGLVAEDPLRRLPRPRVPTRLIATLGPVELERLLAVASRRDRLIIALLLDTGLRLSELAGLRVGDLLPDGYLRVRGKGGKERLVPLGAVTEARLPNYLAHGRPRPIGRDVDHIFLARDGRPRRRPTSGSRPPAPTRPSST